MFRSNSRFVAPLRDGESSDGSVNRGGKRIQILTVCSVFCLLGREQLIMIIFKLQANTDNSRPVSLCEFMWSVT